LIEISLFGLEDEVIPAVIRLFDRWGQGGAIVEQIVGENARSTVKTYLLPEDDEGLRQIEIGLALLNQARTPSPHGDSASSGDTQGLPAPQIRFLAEADWAEAWKSGYDVLHIGHRLVVRPTWRDYTPEAGDLVIAMDPGMAFGSGLHPTTRLCLEALEDCLGPAQAGLGPAQAGLGPAQAGVRPGASVLDVGTGSGILAIAAARLGASRVLALDTDPLAVRVARENVALNGVESVVRVEVGTVQISNLPWPTRQGRQSSISPGLPASPSCLPRAGTVHLSARHPGPRGGARTGRWPGQGAGNLQSPVWDLVVANILAETIIDLAPALAANLSPGGILVVSGIIAERTDAVLASLHQNGLSLVERRNDGEWVALIADKTDGGRMTKDE
jgi:ribosomal protein L11 methyltransferase